MSGKYQTYPEYKDSGVRWLGSIPANWQVKRVKHLTTLNPSKSEVRSRSKDEHVSFIPMEAIGEQGELDASGSRLLGEVLSGYTYVADGDVMLAKITPCFENGKAAVATGLQQGIGFATTEVIPVRPNDPEDAKFFYYLLTSMPFKAVAEGSMYGAGGQKRVADSFVAEYHLAAPPSLERTQIAAFLDHETARIDRLIEKQQRLIELLKEKRQAVISHAVTKGLDPHMPMKDSGIEWLGQVPAHWDVTALKRFWNVVDCKHITAEFFDEGVPLASIREVQSWEVDLRNAKKTSESYYKALIEGGRLPEDGDIIYSRNATVGEAARVTNRHPLFAMGQDVCLLKKANPSIDTDFFMHQLKSRVVSYQLDTLMVGSTFKRINVDDIRNFVIVMPPKEEAIKIRQYLNSIVAKYQRLQQKALNQVELLRERRTALISAAVTGKIDVRNWQPNTSTQSDEPDLPLAAEQAGRYHV